MIANGFEGERQRETEREEDKQIQKIDQGRDKKLGRGSRQSQFLQEIQGLAQNNDFLSDRRDCTNINTGINTNINISNNTNTNTNTSTSTNTSTTTTTKLP